MYDLSDFSDLLEAEKYHPNHINAKPQLLLKDAFELSPDSDQPDATKDQMIYAENKTNGLMFVDSEKCFGVVEGSTLHERAYFVKNGSWPTAENYPIAGGSHREGVVKTNSSTYNSSSLKPDGTHQTRSITSERFKEEIVRNLEEIKKIESM